MAEEETFDQLYQHIKRGRSTAVQDFLEQGGDPNLFNGPAAAGGWNLVMVAAFKGNSRILALLLDHGGRLEDASVVGETALALAAGGGYIKCVQILLDRGASVDIRPLGHSLSLYMEYRGGTHPNVQNLLTEAGAV